MKEYYIHSNIFITDESKDATKNNERKIKEIYGLIKSIKNKTK